MLGLVDVQKYDFYNDKYIVIPYCCGGRISGVRDFYQSYYEYNVSTPLFTFR